VAPGGIRHIVTSGNSHFNAPHDPVNVIQFRALRNVDIDIHALGINLREKFNRFLQTHHQQPSLEHENQHTEGGTVHHQWILKRKLKGRWW
jgi:hypothetical protein